MNSEHTHRLSSFPLQLHPNLIIYFFSSQKCNFLQFYPHWWWRMAAFLWIFWQMLPQFNLYRPPLLWWTVRMQLELILFTKLSLLFVFLSTEVGGKLAENEWENALAMHRNYHYIPEIHRNISLISSPTRFASKSHSPTLAVSLRRLLPVKNLPELRNDSAREEIDNDAVEDNLST